MPESWLFILDLKLDEGLKSGNSVVSLPMSQETWRLAGLEPILDRSASVSVRPCRETRRFPRRLPVCITERHHSASAGIRAYRFAVGDGGEARLAVAVPPELAADVGRLAGYRGAARRHEAAAGRAEVALTDAEQDAQTWDVFG